EVQPRLLHQLLMQDVTLAFDAHHDMDQGHELPRQKVVRLTRQRFASGSGGSIGRGASHHIERLERALPPRRLHRIGECRGHQDVQWLRAFEEHDSILAKGRRHEKGSVATALETLPAWRPAVCAVCMIWLTYCTRTE